MSQFVATRLRVGSIPIVAFLALATACSSPTREVPETSDTVREPVATAEPSGTPSRPTPGPAAERAGTEERISAPSESPVTTAAAPAPAPAPPSAAPKWTRPESSRDPLKLMRDAEARRLENEQLTARLASERDLASELVVRRQKDLLAFKNPFLPRPQLAPDEAAEIKGLGGAARAKWAERRVAEARAALAAAQKAYDDAKSNPPLTP